jgi:hypothetical protein
VGHGGTRRTLAHLPSYAVAALEASSSQYLTKPKLNSQTTDPGQTKRSNLATALPDPRGRKSLPTMLSSTDDFPELWRHSDKTQPNVSLVARSGRGGKRISVRDMRLCSGARVPVRRRLRRRGEPPRGNPRRRRRRRGPCTRAGSGSPARSGPPWSPSRQNTHEPVHCGSNKVAVVGGGERGER